MKKLFKRIAPIVLALVMVLGSCLTVSAGNYSYNYTSTDISVLNSLNSYAKDHNFKSYQYLTFLRSGSTYYYCNTSGPFVYNMPYAPLLCCTSELTGWGLKYSNGTVSVWYDDGYTFKTNNAYFSWTGGDYGFLSNYDVHHLNDSSTVVFDSDTTGFFPTPPPLVAAVKGAAPEEALKEVILLIPLSILFLAGCLGLRKGLRLLLTLLHQA